MCALGVQGARQVRANSELRAIFVFLAPPSVEELEARLRGRGTETDEQVQTRLNTAKQELARQVAAGGLSGVISGAAHGEGHRDR